ncbi:MAG: DPP IV N-terminal domain-containing protein [Anaerolineae bacterium]
MSRLSVMMRDAQREFRQENMSRILSVAIMLGIVVLFRLPSTIIAAQEETQCSDENLKIAYISDYVNDKSDIYVTDMMGKDTQNLTQTIGYNRSPSWSPDGSQIAFTSLRDGNREIYIINTNGESLRNLTNNEAEDVYPKWSPDGLHIAFESTRNDNGSGNRQIYVVNVDGSDLTNLSNNSAHNYLSEWSPDGRKLAFASQQENGSQIAIVDLIQRSVVSIDAPDAQSEINAISWSSDNKYLAFGARTDADNTKQIIYTVDVEGQNLQQLTDETNMNVQPQWSPIGSEILFWSNRGGNLEILLADSNGGNLRDLTLHFGNDSGGIWSPTGIHIAFQTTREGNGNSLYVMDANGDNQHKVADQVLEFSYAWQPCPTKP